ncbi:hypothetical protein COT77_03605 [Candidatus Berkelbacteria bacterium CG10_big_fil_rev_8_21_14_0_10_41_12]|uniref:PDZ domain-containing protein n=1 Tax=Candidatus Berkelbacteria bacterium CG10_big_fil_rev_8_21_14_0_10_41_12 TaxID=1974513 RepID=A0A2M6WW75_9BACT|nr:MAG: hypothetical protein COT77_03605 [Candidatus Berkelbacteria bacterium CG10_big_fil_rev_8_21_14_0_10_41_12]
MDDIKENKRTLITFIVVLSLVCGVVGGVLGVTLTINSSSLQKMLGIENSNGLPTVTKEEKISVKEDSAVVDVVNKVSPVVVSIVFTKDVQTIDPFSMYFGGDGSTTQQQGSGSGFILTLDGLVVTNKHVADVEGAKYTVITNDGKTYDAKVLAQDPIMDMAVLKIDANGLPVVDFGDSDELEVGQRVIAIGNALGEFQNTVTVGVLSAKERSVVAGDATGQGSESLDGLLQTDAAINEGNSGGPMLNLKGQVIGINTATVSKGQAEGIGFAIPINSVLSVLESVKKTGKLVRPYLGVKYALVDKRIAGMKNLKEETGAILVSGDTDNAPAVIPGSPADKAGLKEGDVVLKVGNDTIDQQHSLVRILTKYSPGDKVTLKVSRDGKDMNVDVTLGEISS